MIKNCELLSDLVGVAVVVGLIVRNDETVDWIGIFISVLSWQVTMREW